MIRYIPGTDPLAPQPYTNAERDELVAQVRAATRTATRAGGLAKRGVTLTKKRLAELRANRAAKLKRAWAAARRLRVAEGVVVGPPPRVIRRRK